MFDHLQIYDRRERMMVGLADAGFAVAAAALRPFARRAPADPARRILLLRLERIGDLLMTLPAIAAVRRLAPEARLHLVVGSWNEPLARLVDHIDRVQTLDAGWLSRGGAAPGFSTLLGRARGWRSEAYDLAINFEGDPRSHLLMARAGAPRRIGFDMAGGGPLLTDRVAYDPSRHVAENLLQLVRRAFGVEVSRTAGDHRLKVPDEARERAERLLSEAGLKPGSTPATPIVGVQVGGGRQVKQWPPERFGELAARVASKHGARLVFTGTADDRPLVDAALARVPREAGAVDLCGRPDLLVLAGLVERFSVLVTGDTGPMHLAAAVGTPLVAIFGPSDHRRWGPLSPDAQIVHAGIDCRPCNRIRRPPNRCTGRTPDCLTAVDVSQVADAVDRALRVGRTMQETVSERL